MATTFQASLIRDILNLFYAPHGYLSRHYQMLHTILSSSSLPHDQSCDCRHSRRDHFESSFARITNNKKKSCTPSAVQTLKRFICLEYSHAATSPFITMLNPISASQSHGHHTRHRRRLHIHQGNIRQFLSLMYDRA